MYQEIWKAKQKIISKIPDVKSSTSIFIFSSRAVWTVWFLVIFVHLEASFFTVSVISLRYTLFTIYTQDLFYVLSQ